MKTKIRKSTVAQRARKNTPRRPVRTLQTRPAQTIRLAPVRIKLKSILVPFDFSPPSQKALHYAISFAEQFGATVTLLYVVEPAVYPTELGYVPAEIDALYTSMHQTARQKLVALAKKQVPANLRAQTLVRTGQPHRQI